MSCRGVSLSSSLMTVLLTCAMVRGAGGSESWVRDLPLTEEQLGDLAMNVCLDRFESKTPEQQSKATRCTENFSSPNRQLSALPSKIHIKCRTDSRVFIEVTPSEDEQLIIWVPHTGHETPLYKFINSWSNSDELEAKPNLSYTLWNTVLNSDGTPSVWLKGPHVREFPKVDIHIEDPEFNYTNKTQEVDVTLKWKFISAIDACAKDVTVVNTCNKTERRGLYPRRRNSSMPLSMTIKGVLLDDRCTFTVYKNGAHRRAYSTPLCENLPGCTPPPDRPKDIYIEASEGDSGGWEVFVSWARPRFPPDFYNITLRADSVHNVVLWGNATEVTIANVTGMGLYSVSVDAISTRGNMLTTTRALFPTPDRPKDIYIEASEGDSGGWEVFVSWARPRFPPDFYNITLRADSVHNVVLWGNATEVTIANVTGMGLYSVSVDAISTRGNMLTTTGASFPRRVIDSSSMGVIMAGAWSGVLLTATALVGLVICYRRRANMATRFYFQGLDDNPLKECSLEYGQESGVEDSWEVRSERLLLHEVIGEGAFGVVRRGTLSPGSKEVAVKMLKDFPAQEEIRSFRVEMELMKSVGAHPHVVSLIGCCTGRRPLIVAEYCSRGDLLNFLRCSWDIMVSKRNAKYYNNNIENYYRNDLFKKPQKEHSKLVVNKLYDLQAVCDAELTSLDLLSFCRQIVMGMEFLASNRVIHRDLAARNILVTGDRTLKIADFGLSRDVYQENQYKQKGNGKMPVKWMALESLTHRIYTTQSDVWSFGVVVWEVVTLGAAPYPDVPAARLPRLLRAGYRMPRPTNCSKQLYEVMSSCWRARPRDRPTFAELHAALDELLNSACADEYLDLELDADEPPPTPKAQRYVKMLLRGNRVWARGESYERPLKTPQSNHYTSPPAPIHRTQPV